MYRQCVFKHIKIVCCWAGSVFADLKCVHRLCRLHIPLGLVVPHHSIINVYDSNPEEWKNPAHTQCLAVFLFSFITRSCYFCSFLVVFIMRFMRGSTRAPVQEFLPLILMVRLLLARSPVFRHHHHHLHNHCCRRRRRLLNGKVFVSIYFVILKVSWGWV